jgi:hypothetical protein
MASYLHITTQMITCLCREHILNGNWMADAVNTTLTVCLDGFLRQATERRLATGYHKTETVCPFAVCNTSERVYK